MTGLDPDGDAPTIGGLRRDLEAVAVPEDAEPMAAYMRHQFPFLGVRSPALRAVVKPLYPALAGAGPDAVVGLADDCWAEPEREFQYAGVALLRRFATTLEPPHLDDLYRYITTKSWWDTVDGLAAWCVGPLVTTAPQLAATMDRWIGSDDHWVARSALLHQLGYKERTDADRLFRYAAARAGDEEFFIRKAIGWALRQYARTDPDAVRRFVADHEDRLSTLSKREALKHLDPG